MSLNCNEINVVLSELNLEGSFIQDVVQPGYDTVALYTYGKDGARTILICTSRKFLPHSRNAAQNRKK